MCNVAERKSRAERDDGWNRNDALPDHPRHFDRVGRSRRRQPFPPKAAVDLQLAPEGAAIDKGAALASINDGFTGAAPDLGAYELGVAPPVYGPRTGGGPGTGGVTGTGGGAGAGIDAGAGTGGSVASGGQVSNGGAAGLAGAPGTGDATTAKSSGCGCSTSNGSDGDLAGLAPLALICIRRRRSSARSG